MLTLEGHSVASCLNAKEGVELFKKEKFDIVFTDLAMPEMSGWQLATKIKEINPSVEVVMVTGWGKQVNREEMKRYGVDFSLAKPFQSRELFDLVARVIDKRKNV